MPSGSRFNLDLSCIPDRSFLIGHCGEQRASLGSIAGPICKYIASYQIRKSLASIDVSTHNDCEVAIVSIFDYWIYQRLTPCASIRTPSWRNIRVVGIETMPAFSYMPSIISAFGYDIYLLPQILTGITRKEFVVTICIERYSIWIP